MRDLLGTLCVALVAVVCMAAMLIVAAKHTAQPKPPQAPACNCTTFLV